MVMVKVVQQYCVKAKGVSLIELGVVILFISLALVPVINTIGGPRSSSGKGNAVQLNSVKAKETIAANTMVDKVLSGDLRNIDCDPETDEGDLPTGNTSKTFAKCEISDSNGTLQSQWTVVSLNNANNGTDMPAENFYYQATLNIIDKTSGNTLITLPTNFFRNEGAYLIDQGSTGIMLSLDISHSMTNPDENGFPMVDTGNVNYGEFSSPFLFYRYKDNAGNSPFPTGAPVPGGWGENFSTVPSHNFLLNKWDNSQLDLVYGQQITGNPKGDDPTPGTPNNEAFPFASVASPGAWGNGILGSGDCSTITAANQDDDKGLQFTFLPIHRHGAYSWSGFGTNAQAKNVAYSVIRNLCQEKTSFTQWSNIINTNLSRLEAARTASLSLLTKLESKPSIAKTLEMGFVQWGSSLAPTRHHVALEKAQTVSGVAGVRFKEMREKMLWINRADPKDRTSLSPIVVQGDLGTRIDIGLRSAMAKFENGKDYSRRIVILMTDGKPCNDDGDPPTGNNTHANLISYSKQMGQQDVTLYAVGLIQADPVLLGKMVDAAKATGTPGGKQSQSFIADDVASLKPIFDTIAYQIQKQALLDSAGRYGITL